MDDLLQDLRYGIRNLRGSPGFTVAAVAILALGIGGTTVGFSLLDAFFLRPLPYPDADRLVQLGRVDPQRGFDGLRFSLPNVLALRQGSEAFEELAAYRYVESNLASPAEEPEAVTVGHVTTDLLALLGAEPTLGRRFLPTENEPGSGDVALLSHGLWQRRFGGSEEILESTTELDGAQHTVVGVMPPGFRFPFGGVKIWVPVVEDPARFGRESRSFMPVGRIAPGVDRRAARAEVEELYRRAHELDSDADVGYGIRLEPLRDALLFLDDLLRLSLTMAVVAGGFVLLIVSANLANLVLVRVGGRGRELAIRSP